MILCTIDGRQQSTRFAFSDGKSVRKPPTKLFRNKRMLRQEWKDREVYVRSTLRNRNDESRNESKGIRNERGELIVRVERLGGQHETYITRNKL